MLQLSPNILPKSYSLDYKKDFCVLSPKCVILHNMQQVSYEPALTSKKNQPLIGVEVEKNGESVTYYFDDEKQADKVLSGSTAPNVLSLAGVWDKLNWSEIATSLDKIRHQSQPTEPLEI